MPIEIMNLEALDAIGLRLTDVLTADARPLMEEWERILLEEHTAGVLRGEDADGVPMPPTVRERTPELSQRLGSGPPLVPNYEASRAIRLAHTASGIDNGQPFAVLGWDSFVSSDGRSILGMHADPDSKARYPRRNLIGVRPEAQHRALDAMITFVQSLLNRPLRK